MEEQNLYQNVRKQICRMIYEDIYRDGEYIPPERRLSEELGVSRVTVRKALKLLEEEHIIERIQGSGTRVALQYGARTGNMDIITLVAPAQNSFFPDLLMPFRQMRRNRIPWCCSNRSPAGYRWKTACIGYTKRICAM